jgi:hypothetical protein
MNTTQVDPPSRGKIAADEIMMLTLRRQGKDAEADVIERRIRPWIELERPSNPKTPEQFRLLIQKAQGAYEVALRRNDLPAAATARTRLDELSLMLSIAEDVALRAPERMADKRARAAKAEEERLAREKADQAAAEAMELAAQPMARAMVALYQAIRVQSPRGVLTDPLIHGARRAVQIACAEVGANTPNFVVPILDVLTKCV